MLRLQKQQSREAISPKAARRGNSFLKPGEEGGWRRPAPQELASSGKAATA